jgi:hypothetical protein
VIQFIVIFFGHSVFITVFIASSIFQDKSQIFDSTFLMSDHFVRENPVSLIAFHISSHLDISFQACDGVVGIIFETGIFDNASNVFQTIGSDHHKAALFKVDHKLVSQLFAISTQAHCTAHQAAQPATFDIKPAFFAINDQGVAILLNNHSHFHIIPVGHQAASIIPAPPIIFPVFTPVLYA